MDNIELKIYEKIEKELENGKPLFLGEKSLSRALYIAGKMAGKGNKFESRAIIPSNSPVKTEEEAINLKENKEIKKEGIPYTTYRIGELETEDKKYQVIVDERPNAIKEMHKTVKKLKDNGLIIIKTTIDYLYPLKATYKGLFKTKTKEKTIQEVLKDQKLEMINYESIEDKEILIKAKNKGFRKKYLSIEPFSSKELGEKIAEEILPETEYAKEGSRFCIKSDSKNLLYNIKEVKKIKKPTKIKFKLPTGKTTYEKDEKTRKSKKIKIEVKPNTEKNREEIEESRILIMPKGRIKDYYT